MLAQQGEGVFQKGWLVTRMLTHVQYNVCWQWREAVGLGVCPLTISTVPEALSLPIRPSRATPTLDSRMQATADPV